MHIDAGRNPKEEIRVDLEQQIVGWRGHEYRFEIDPFVKACLKDGVDEIGYILSYEPEIAAFEERRAERQYEMAAENN